MTLLNKRYNFTTEIKWYLSSYRAHYDVKLALDAFSEEQMTFSRWKVYWAGICALLKTSIHLVQVDARACLPGPLKEALGQAWHRLRTDQKNYPLFWEFIDHERNNILKEYAFSAYEKYFQQDGTEIPYPSLLSMIDSKQVLMLRGGLYDGRPAIEVATEATVWVGQYLIDTITAIGIDPDERVNSAQFLRRQKGEPDTPGEDVPAGGRLLAYLQANAEREVDETDHVSQSKPEKDA